MSTEQTVKGRGRKPRTAINGVRNILKITGQEAGFTYRVVNDVGDRIEQLKAIGYEIVQDDKVQVGDRRVTNPTKDGSPTRVSVGNGDYGYVMRIKDEWYEEDKVKKAEHIANTERAILHDAKTDSDYGKLSLDH